MNKTHTHTHTLNDKWYKLKYKHIEWIKLKEFKWHIASVSEKSTCTFTKYSIEIDGNNYETWQIEETKLKNEMDR